MVKTETYMVTTEKKPTYLDVKKAEPLTGKVPLKFKLHFTLNSTEEAKGLNGKDCHLYVKKPGDTEFSKVDTITSHGIFGWYGAIGWVNGCVDFSYTCTEAGMYEIYGEFPGDAEYEGCRQVGVFQVEEEKANPASRSQFIKLMIGAALIYAVSKKAAG